MQDNSALGRAIAVVSDLRKRCPWDRVQTRETLRPYLVESIMVLDHDWTIKAKIPLVGGALEKFVVSDLERRSAEETEIAIRMLKDYR